RRASDLPPIGQHAGEERHRDRTDVVGGQERPRLREAEAEVLLEERGDGGNTERPDVRDRLRDDDERQNRVAIARRARVALARPVPGAYPHERRAARRASTARRSASVSTPIVGSSVSTTTIGMPCSRNLSCSSFSV